jgi:hypothetical protein
MVSYKNLYLEEKLKFEEYQNRNFRTGKQCPLCLEKNIRSELIFYEYGELVCENEECSFDKDMGTILYVYYQYKDIGDLEE